MNLRESRHWDKQLESGLPDSRLSGMSRVRTVVRIGRMDFERVFCANCGHDGGLVTAEWSPHIFYLCDPCADKYGGTIGIPEIPEDIVTGKRSDPAIQPPVETKTT